VFVLALVFKTQFVILLTLFVLSVYATTAEFDILAAEAPVFPHSSKRLVVEAVEVEVRYL
jgi:hypothetical protein